jgi:phosphoribosylpyrophosphate synthetase
VTTHFSVKLPGDYIHGAAEPFQYPGGEWHLRNLADVRDPAAVWIADVRFRSADDLVQAALFADVAHQRQAPFMLFLPYLPAARSDRPMAGQPVGVATYSQLINSMNPQQVIGIDAHSPIVHRHLRKLTELSPVPLVQRALKNSAGYDGYHAVIAPDKGAVERAATTATALGVDMYRADKDRDEETGRINGIKMVDKLPKSGKYLVVDDICDGGGTFMGLAQATGLPKEQLGLWITHGIFSGNAPNLRDHYRYIYTTDTHPGHNRVGCATAHQPVFTYMINNLKEF